MGSKIEVKSAMLGCPTSASNVYLISRCSKALGDPPLLTTSAAPSLLTCMPSRVREDALASDVVATVYGEVRAAYDLDYRGIVVLAGHLRSHVVSVVRVASPSPHVLVR